MSLLALIQANRPQNAQSVQAASIFAAQAVLCAAVLVPGFRLVDPGGAVWALVSAVLVLQPGFQQSLAASLTRITANVIGAAAGVLIGLFVGRDDVAVMLAFIVIIFLCEYLRLDMGVRTACVSVAIVLVKGSGSVVHSGLERAGAVIAGCLFGMLLQFITERWIRPAANYSPR